jgi:hypothetical protein
MRSDGQNLSVNSFGRETLLDLMGKIKCPQKVPSIVSLTLTPDKRIYLRFKNKLQAAWFIIAGEVRLGARRYMPGTLRNSAC